MIVPGGFSYGDYLRAGAIASLAPIMTRGRRPRPGRGMPVLGICNGFQILCEAGLLPGALVRNAGLHFVCRDQRLRVESTATAWTGGLAAGPGDRSCRSSRARAVTSPTPPRSSRLEGEGRVVFRYVGGNPNGALSGIAGISSADGRVVGLMPHPEHAIDAADRPVRRRARRCSRRCCDRGAGASDRAA